MIVLPSPFRTPAVRILETTLGNPQVGEEPMVKLDAPTDAARLLYDLIGRADREHFVALYLNARHAVTFAHVVSRGTTHSAPIHPREVFKGALLANASGLVVGHNHPSGDVTPSEDDRQVTERLRRVGELMGIELLDALIVTPQGDFHTAAEQRVGRLADDGPGGARVGYEQNIRKDSVCPLCGEFDVELCFPVWIPVAELDNRERWNVDFDAQPDGDPGKGWCPRCAENVAISLEV